MGGHGARILLKASKFGFCFFKLPCRSSTISPRADAASQHREDTVRSTSQRTFALPRTSWGGGWGWVGARTAGPESSQREGKGISPGSPGSLLGNVVRARRRHAGSGSPGARGIAGRLQAFLGPVAEATPAALWRPVWGGDLPGVSSARRWSQRLYRAGWGARRWVWERGAGRGRARTPGDAARRGPWVRGQSPRPPRRCVAGVAAPRDTRGEGASCQVSWSVPGLLRAGVGGGGLSSRRPLWDGKTIARSRRARARGVPGSGPAPWMNELISSFEIYALKSGCALPPDYRRRNGQSGQLICHI